jgi:hypothetical protein
MITAAAASLALLEIAWLLADRGLAERAYASNSSSGSESLNMPEEYAFVHYTTGEASPEDQPQRSGV